MASKIEPRIMDRAIELFADYGYYGVTTRDLARKAKVTEGSIYRLFRSKKELFESALKAATDRSLDPAQIALEVLNKLTAQNFSSLLISIIHRWYFSLPRAAARLLTQAYFADPGWRQIAYEPIDKIIDILTKVIEQHSRTRKLDAAITARTLIMALLHFKITYASSCSQKEEAAIVNAMIRQWLSAIQET